MIPPPFPSRIPFGSFLVYPSPALTDDAKRARSAVLRIKADRASHIAPLTIVEYAIQELRRRLNETPLDPILGRDVTFVPIPKSAPLLKDGVWPSRSICRALVANHFGRDWQAIVERVTACEKSAFCKPDDRPLPTRHYETMRADVSLIAPAAIVMVDDVITKGTTFLGAAARLREVFPDVPIAAFAVARTCSDFSTVRKPCAGEIIFNGPATWPTRKDWV